MVGLLLWKRSRWRRSQEDACAQPWTPKVSDAWGISAGRWTRPNVKFQNRSPRRHRGHGLHGLHGLFLFIWPMFASVWRVAIITYRLIPLNRYAESSASNIGHSLVGPFPLQAAANVERAFFILISACIFPSISAIFVFVCILTSPHVVFGSTRNERSSDISLRVNPRSLACMMNWIRVTASWEYCL